MANRWVAHIGYVLLASIFVISGIAKAMHWGATYAVMSQRGIPAANVALVIVIIVELGGGVMLMIGLWPRWPALVLFLYLIPVTLTMHNFWMYSGNQRQMQQINFLKNISIMGGLLVCAAIRHAPRRVRGGPASLANRGRTRSVPASPPLPSP